MSRTAPRFEGGRATELPAADAGRDSQPLVSVVIPARNEEAFLATCLDSVLTQRYPPTHLDIIVVENGSSDRTRAVALAYATHHDRVRVLSSAATHQAGAMNEGIREARGSIIVRVDAHGFVAPDYVREVVAALARHPEAAAVGGPYLPTGEGVLERVAGLARSTSLGVGGGWGTDASRESHPVRTVGCPAYRREALLAVGLFDVAMRYAEDDELNWRLLKGGSQIRLCPSLRQYNRPRASLRALGRQYWHYGEGRVRVVLKHRDFVQTKHLIPSAFVLIVTALAVAATFATFARAALLVVLALYGLVLAGAALGATRHGWRVALLVPVAVAVIHLAYGSGFLSGAARHLLGRLDGRIGAQEATSC